jgi:hypothetical protein
MNGEESTTLDILHRKYPSEIRQPICQDNEDLDTIAEAWDEFTTVLPHLSPRETNIVLSLIIELTYTMGYHFGKAMFEEAK